MPDPASPEFLASCGWPWIPFLEATVVWRNQVWYYACLTAYSQSNTHCTNYEKVECGPLLADMTIWRASLIARPICCARLPLCHVFGTAANAPSGVRWAGDHLVKLSSRNASNHRKRPISAGSLHPPSRRCPVEPAQGGRDSLAYSAEMQSCQRGSTCIPCSCSRQRTRF
jgi:hypothetical protein